MAVVTTDTGVPVSVPGAGAELGCHWNLSLQRDLCGLAVLCRSVRSLPIDILPWDPERQLGLSIPVYRGFPETPVVGQRVFWDSALRWGQHAFRTVTAGYRRYTGRARATPSCEACSGARQTDPAAHSSPRHAISPPYPMLPPRAAGLLQEEGLPET